MEIRYTTPDKVSDKGRIFLDIIFPTKLIAEINSILEHGAHTLYTQAYG